MSTYILPTWKVSNLTVAFEDIEHVRSFYAFEAFALLQNLEAKKSTVEAQMAESNLVETTRERLRGFASAYDRQVECLSKILSPFGHSSVSMSDHLSYIQHRPGPNSLTPNFENLFRDWGWGQEETKKTFEAVKRVADGIETWGRTLNLGAGGCRLAYDTHKEFSPLKTIVQDFNPLLLLVAQKVTSGKKVELVEFPTVTAAGKSSFFERTLSAPEAVSKNFDFVVADARNPVFEAGSFDVVVTPWLIDAIDMDLADFLTVINHLLPVGGHWINTGPLQFGNRGPKNAHGIDEIEEIAATQGFEILNTDICHIEYMKSPEIGTHRVEESFSFCAKKINDVDLVEYDPLLGQPDWYIDHDLSVHFPVDRLKIVEGHELNAKILRLVDGKNSLNQIATELLKDLPGKPGQVKYLAAQIIKNAVTHI